MEPVIEMWFVVVNRYTCVSAVQVVECRYKMGCNKHLCASVKGMRPVFTEITKYTL